MSLKNISREDIIKLLQGLVSIQSVNPSLAPEEGTGELEIANFGKEWLSKHSINAWIDEVEKNRTNLVAKIGTGEGPTLVLCAHIDTVSAAGMDIPPFEPTIKDNKLYGRGSYDMKGSAAMIMAVAAELAKEEIPGKLMLALVADEEHSSIGAFDFVKKYKADACILTEPSEEKVVLAHKGFIWYEIEVNGIAAHGSRWDLGESAISKSAKIITALDDLDKNILRKRSHKLTGPASMHCSLITGGEGISTYAPSCKLSIERRTIPGENPAEVTKEIEDIVKAVYQDVSIKELLMRMPATCDEDELIAQCVKESFNKINNTTTEEIGVSYWMDMAVFTEAGIPTVNIGPSGGGAHAAVEWVDVDSVMRCTGVLLETVKRFYEMK